MKTLTLSLIQDIKDQEHDLESVLPIINILEETYVPKGKTISDFISDILEELDEAPESYSFEYRDVLLFLSRHINILV